MSKVTSKLQVTIPKTLAGRYGIRPGDEVRWEWLARGAVMVRVPPGEASGGEGVVGEGALRLERTRPESRTPALIRDPAERLAHFDRQSRWIEALLEGRPDEEAVAEEKRIARAKRERGWSREDLYGDRGFPRPR